MADYEPINMGGGPPWNYIPGISTVYPVSPHTQVERPDLAYLFASSGVTTWQWCLKTLCAEMIDLFHIGTFRSICISAFLSFFLTVLILCAVIYLRCFWLSGRGLVLFIWMLWIKHLEFHRGKSLSKSYTSQMSSCAET